MNRWIKFLIKCSKLYNDKELVDKVTQKNMNVYDAFGGSGSTLIACEQLNRNCYMMELDPKYCQVIINRILKLKPDLKVQCLNRTLDPISEI